MSTITRALAVEIQCIESRTANMGNLSFAERTQLQNDLIDLNQKVGNLKAKYPEATIEGEGKLSGYFDRLFPGETASSSSSSAQSVDSGVEIQVECSLAEGEFLEVKGTGDLLSSGIRLHSQEAGVHRVFLKGLCPDQDYRICLNGTVQESGSSHRIHQGTVPLNIPGREGRVTAAFVGPRPIEQLVEFTVKIALAEGESIGIRGTGSILNWGRDIPLEKVGEGTYRVVLRGLYTDTQFKLVLNGNRFEEGDNHRVNEKIAALHFPGYIGEVVASACDFHRIIADKVHDKVKERRSSLQRPSRFLQQRKTDESKMIRDYFSREEWVHWNHYSEEDKVIAFTNLIQGIPIQKAYRAVARLVTAFRGIAGMDKKNEVLFQINLQSSLCRLLDRNYASLLERLSTQLQNTLSQSENLFLFLFRLQTPGFMESTLLAWKGLSEYRKLEMISEILLQMKPHQSSMLIHQLSALFLSRIFPEVFDTEALKIAALGRIVACGRECNEEYSSYRLVLEQFAKNVYESLSPESQRNLRYAIYKSNGKSSLFHGQRRDDLGRYIVENALFSSLCAAGIRSYIENDTK